MRWGRHCRKIRGFGSVESMSMESGSAGSRSIGSHTVVELATGGKTVDRCFHKLREGVWQRSGVEGQVAGSTQSVSRCCWQLLLIEPVQHKL